MKRLLAILVVAAMVISMLSMTTVLSAATADIVNQAGEGTAVIDGTKDEAYDTATPLDFVQKGKTNGSGEVLDAPIGQAWVINDAENVYVFFSVIDSELDNTSTNNYETDSVDVFWMKDNEKQQWRLYFDDTGSADSGVAPDGFFKTVTTDTGYDVECYFPITDVLNNQIEMCLQINACSGGKRDYTCYILGNQDADDAYQRTNRQTNYDVWWTLALTGEHEDTRVDPVEEPAELTVKNYIDIRDNSKVYVQLYTQNTYDWSGWASIGTGEGMALGGSVSPEGWKGLFAPVVQYTVEQIPDWANLPIFAIQVGDDQYLEPSVKNDDGTWKDSGTFGDTARYQFTYTDITVKANGYNDVVIPGGVLSGRWTAKSEGSYTSGTSFTIDLIGPAKDQLGLDVEGACTWLANVTDVLTTITYDTHELLTPADIAAFEETIPALEQEWIDTNESLAEQVTKAQEALTAAQGAASDTAALEDALKDANSAKNRSQRERESGGWLEGGTADTYINDTFDAIINEIQGLVDAAAAAPAPAEDQPEAPAEDQAEAPAEEAPAEAPSSSESGSSTGLIVGIIVVVVIVVIVVVAVVLGKKKK